MPIEILMPALSPTMTEGNLAKWTVKEGDKIKSGQVIAEIETDKATMEVEAVDEGVMGKIVVAGGTEGVKVNQLIALLLEEGEDKKALETYKPKAAAAPKEEAAPAASAASPAPAAAPAPSAAPSMAPSQSPSLPASTPAPMRSAGERVFASPLAKRVAAQEGVDVGSVQGTGPHGRVLKDDVLKAKSSGNLGRSGRVMRNPVEFTKIPNSNMRKVIARRLTESKQQVPHFYLTVEVELNRLLDIRKDINFEAEAIAGKNKKPA
jgi:pyruvate dehydrogenase E2 component (dihydrolipoamide acetyltransferase)